MFRITQRPASSYPRDIGKNVSVTAVNFSLGLLAVAEHHQYASRERDERKEGACIKRDIALPIISTRRSER